MNSINVFVDNVNIDTQTTYSENGKMSMTAGATSFVGKDLVNVESDYVVVGNLIFKLLPKENVGEGYPSCIVSRVIYTQNGTSLGDILTETSNLVNNDFEVIETTSRKAIPQPHRQDIRL